MSRATCESDLKDLTDRARTFINFPVIFEKVSRSGWLNELDSSLSRVFAEEILFATSELSKSPNMKAGSSNLTEMVERNLFVFKENLKIVAGLCS